MGASIIRDFVLASNGHCFFCLGGTELQPDPNLSSPLAKQTNSLQYLTRYLKMDLKKVFVDKGEVSPELLKKIKKARLTVELCEECRCLSESFSKVYRQLEKLELELGSTLGLIHGKLASADATGILRALSSGPNSNWNGLLEVVDVLRAEAIQKSSHKLSQTPRVKVQHLTEIEVKAKQATLKSDEESSQMAPNAEMASHLRSEQRGVKMESPNEASSSDKVKAKQSMVKTVEENLQMATNAEVLYHRGLETNAVKIESPAEDGYSLADHDNGNYFSEDFNSNLYSEHTNGYMKIEGDLNADESILPQGQDLMIRNKKVISLPKRNFVVSSQCSIDPETGKRKCNDCYKKYSSGPAFIQHYQTVHLKLRYECISCNKLFSSKAHLRRHQSSSLSCLKTESAHERKCHLCEISFSRKDHLQKHLDGVHYKLQKYECNLCGKKFSVKDYLNAHLRKEHRMGKIDDQ